MQRSQAEFFADRCRQFLTRKTVVCELADFMEQPGLASDPAAFRFAVLGKNFKFHNQGPKTTRY